MFIGGIKLQHWPKLRQTGYFANRKFREALSVFNRESKIRSGGEVCTLQAPLEILYTQYPVVAVSSTKKVLYIKIRLKFFVKQGFSPTNCFAGLFFKKIEYSSCVTICCKLLESNVT